MVNKREYTDLENRIQDELMNVVDPELGIDVVNLGLIYDIYVDEANKCWIKMTLTTIGCPLADVIIMDIEDALDEIEEVDSVDVQVVWEPAWGVDKMSRYARIALGIPG